jgi:hypothetical protein
MVVYHIPGHVGASDLRRHTVTDAAAAHAGWSGGTQRLANRKELIWGLSVDTTNEKNYDSQIIWVMIYIYIYVYNYLYVLSIYGITIFYGWLILINYQVLGQDRQMTVLHRAIHCKSNTINSAQFI